MEWKCNLARDVMTAVLRAKPLWEAMQIDRQLDP